MWWSKNNRTELGNGDIIYALLVDTDNFNLSHNEFVGNEAWLAAPDRSPMLLVSRNVPTCGCCGEVIYTRCNALFHHVFSARSKNTCTWFSKDMGILVHECGADLSELIPDFAEIPELAGQDTAAQ